MALSESRLENKIIAIIDAIKVEEVSASDVKTKFAKDLAKAMVEEIKELKINYSNGLVAGSTPVTGTLNATIS
jgi:hypothetical protein